MSASNKQKIARSRNYLARYICQITSLTARLSNSHLIENSEREIIEKLKKDLMYLQEIYREGTREVINKTKNE
jgi:phosphoenolpyruvate carboxylase